MEYVQLNNGIKMPMLGYGVYQVTKNECERCVTDALSVGYRLIDTAQSYFNEEEVGAAITKSGIPLRRFFSQLRSGWSITAMRSARNRSTLPSKS